MQTWRAPRSPKTDPGDTEREHEDLLAAIGRNCACSAGQASAEPDRCAPHELLLREPTLKRLVFYHRWQDALRRGEWLEAPQWVDED